MIFKTSLKLASFSGGVFRTQSNVFDGFFAKTVNG